MKKIVLILFIGLSLISCGQVDSTSQLPNEVIQDTVPTAYFGSGCFWCSEAIFETIEGVYEAESGYAGGNVINPSYKDVCSGTTGHAETVKIYYDSTKVSFEELLEVFFNSHDPSTLNQQGPDSGTQYRSVAFYKTESEKAAISNYIEKLKNQNIYPVITTTIEEIDVFYIAEDYHQDYVKNNINKSYVQNVSKPRMFKFLEKRPASQKSNPFN
jgi:peptide-methionine (S)-S-oxide reductase